MRTGALVVVGVALVMSGFTAPARVLAVPPVACDALAQIPIANGTLLAAEPVEAGAFKVPVSTNVTAAAAFSALPAFCRVIARLTPTPDSDIRVEVWLPLCGWNRKLQAVGNGVRIEQNLRHLGTS